MACGSSFLQTNQYTGGRRLQRSLRLITLSFRRPPADMPWIAPLDSVVASWLNRLPIHDPIWLCRLCFARCKDVYGKACLIVLLFFLFVGTVLSVITLMSVGARALNTGSVQRKIVHNKLLSASCMSFSWLGYWLGCLVFAFASGGSRALCTVAQFWIPPWIRCCGTG